MFLTRFLFLFLVILSCSLLVFAQTPAPTPPEEKPEVIYTEEIKVNIAAFDLNGDFAQTVNKEDLVINEDGRLHQANIIQRIPAKVLILMDTGGENRQAKDFLTTKNTALNLINFLQKDDQVALMQYHDRVELISEWTSDKELLTKILAKKANFGMRSLFTEAIREATQYLSRVDTENRHLVLISDGLDSISGREQRLSALKKLTADNINVHVFSYTQMEQKVVEQRKKSITGGGKKTIELPAGADIPIPNKVQTSPIATVNLDKEMVKQNKQRGDALKVSENDLIKLSDETNGIFYLPDTKEEMLEKTEHLAKNIDSQYVITYTPKRSLNESPNGEVRTIEVTSKREGVIVQAKRKLLIVKEKSE